MYDGEVVQRLALIALAKRHGFTLAEIRTLLGAAADGDHAGWPSLVAAKADDMEHRIAEATSIRERLLHALRVGAESLSCRVKPSPAGTATTR